MLQLISEFGPLVLSLAGAGILAGFLSGLFGIGGGAVLVPILIAAFTFSGVNPHLVTHMAVATSMAIIIPTAVRSYLAHRARGAGNRALLKSWTWLVPLGVVAASFVVGIASGDVLKFVFIVVAAVIAAKMLFAPKGWLLATELPSQGITRLVGFAIGFISTFMGIGGGNLNNLFMTSFGQPMHQAVATSAGLGVLIAIPATLGYVITGWGVEGLPSMTFGYVHMAGVALIAPFSTLVAPLGVKAAHRMSPRGLEIGFGLFLVVVVLKLAAGII